MTEILIYGPIGMGFGTTAEQVIDELAGAAGNDVLVRINSAGGSFDEGPAIFNALAGYEGPLATEVDGVAYSMASMVLQAGRPRRMAANAVLMVHGSQFFAEGSAEDMRKTAEMMDVHTEAMVSAFTARGIPDETARGWLTDGEDHYFTADQALESGLIDEITAAVDMTAALTHIPTDVQLPQSLAAYRNPKTKETTMPENQVTDSQAPGNQAPKLTAGIDVKALTDSRNKDINAGVKAGKQSEVKRHGAIRSFFDRPQFSDADEIGADNVAAFMHLRDACLADLNVTPDQARDAAIDLQGGMAPPILGAATQTQVEGSSFGSIKTSPDARKKIGRPATAGVDASEKLIAGMTEALCVKSGLEHDSKVLTQAQSNEFLAMSAYEMARRYLDMNGIAATGARREHIIGQAMVTASNGITHSTSDFASILENVANKALLAGWDEAEETWQRWARTGSLQDFKQGSRVNLSTFGDLDLVYAHGEYKYGSFSDLKETLTLATYGKLFGISRQALANDDLSALSSIPRGMGRAAARKIGDLAYAVLTTNAALNQDSTELFHADHNNLGTGGPISVAPSGTLDEAWTDMGLQTDPAGNVLNISPAHIVVPRALEISTMSAIADATFPDSSNAQARQNPFQNRLTVTADARLDSSSATQWYVMADSNRHDTVEVAFLNGQQSPYLEAQDGWKVDGVEYKVRIDAVAAALDFRTMYRNAGA